MLNQALARDGFRCMITGMFDETSLKLSAELRRKHESLGGMPITVKTCHILSESTQGVGTNGERTTGNEVCIIAGPSIVMDSPHQLPRHIMPPVF